MSNEVSNSGLSLLLNLLKAISQNQEINLLLQQNLDKLNGDFVCLLRKWAFDQFNDKPNKAINIAKVIFKFSNVIQKFEQGNKDINLEIAIAGYEIALQVLTSDNFPNDWANIQQELSEVYQKRQKILSNTIVTLKAEIEQHQTYINSISETLPQELQQTQLQIEQLTTTLAQLKEESINLTQNEDIQQLMTEYEDIKINQKIIQQLFNKDYLSFTQQHFNTAIFYDIENLTMGRSNPNLNFSLKLIQEHLKKLALVKKVAIQCAYADWSDYKLRFLRKEIQESGIEPIQIFDFGYKKNAADIQLAIDVMELVALRPTLQVFVIVSGDGAFASLAKKLHEYGKAVIGCAYNNQTNNILFSVCDHFIFLPESKGESKNGNTNSAVTMVNHENNPLINNPIKVLEYIQFNEPYSSLLNKDGIEISTLKQILIQFLPNFDYKKQGFKNFKTYLKSVCEGTNLILSYYQGDRTRTILKIKENYENKEIHSVVCV